MESGLRGIDHVVIGVRDLEEARRAYERLGFVLTPIGPHKGRGTANHCLMFARDYVELLGIVDRAQLESHLEARRAEGGGRPADHLDALLEGREGMLAVALASEDAETTRAFWEDAGLSPSSLRDLARRIKADSAEIELRFRNVLLGPGETGGIGLFACEHRTREAMRREAWLGHANGALAIASISVLAPDPHKLAPAMGQAFGAARVTTTDDIVAVHTGSGVILIADPDDMDMLHPELDNLPLEAEPVLAALTIAVEDAGRTAELLEEAGIAIRRDRSGAVGVAARDAHGVMLELVPLSAAPEIAARYR